MQLTVVNSRSGEMQVHREGCRDIARAATNGNFNIEVATQEEALRDIWCDFIDEWDGDLSVGEDSTRFFPCCEVALSA